MPCDISSGLKGGYETVFGFKFLNDIFSSSIWSALVITLIIGALVMLCIPIEPGSSMSGLFRFLFYSFVISLMVLTLHKSTAEIKSRREEEEAVPETLKRRLEGGNPIILEESDVIKIEPVVHSSVAKEEPGYVHMPDNRADDVEQTFRLYGV